MKPRKEEIAIIGPGRLGQAIGKLLVEAGFPVRLIAGRRLAAARRATRFIGRGRAITLGSQDFGQASAVLIATSDAALAPLASELAAFEIDWRSRVILHTSGSVPSSVLSPLQRCAAAIGSLHPFPTIPNPAAGMRNLRGCYWGIEGDPAARRVATRWVKALGGVAFAVQPEKKILYHVAAFLVCPTVVTLMDQSARLLKFSGVPDKIARPMLGRFVAETARNFVDLGGPRALTGRATRGDWQIIRRHLAALRRDFPDAVPLYQELLRAMLRLAAKRPPVGLLGTRRR